MICSSTCLYCGQKITQDAAPVIGDNSAWRLIAREHARDCKWVLTRGFRGETVRICEQHSEQTADQNFIQSWWRAVTDQYPTLAERLRNVKPRQRVFLASEQLWKLGRLPGWAEVVEAGK
jgi:hypothetical protein